jgi:YesN/AraC family two-component response regulator
MYRQIMLLTIGVVIISTVSIIILLYYDFADEMLEKIGSNNYDSLQKTALYMDTKIKTMNQIAITNKAYKKSKKICETRYENCIQDVYSLMNSITNVTDDVDFSMLYCQKFDYVIGINPQVKSEFWSYTNIFDTEWKSMLNDDYNTHKLFLHPSSGGNNYLVSATPVRSNPFKVIGVIFSGLHLDNLKSEILNKANNTTQNVIVISPDGSFSFDGNGLDSETLAQFINATSEFNNEYRLLDIDGTQYLIASTYSSDSGCSYISYIESDLLLKNLNIISGLSLILVTLLVLLTLLFSFFLSKRIYRPVSKLGKYVQSLYPYKLKGDDIINIEKTLIDMRSDNEKLERIVSDNKYLLKFKELCYYIYGISDKNQISHEIDFNQNSFCAILFSITYESADDNVARTDLLTAQTANKIEIYISNTKYNGEVFRTFQNEILVIFSSNCLQPENQTEEIISFCQDICNLFSHAKFNAGIGTLVKTPEMIRESYLNAKCALDYAITYIGNTILTYTEISNISGSTLHLTEYAHTLETLLANKNVEKLHETIDKIISNIARRESDYTKEEINDFFLKIIANAIQSLSHINTHIANSLSCETWLMDFMKVKTYKEKGCWMKEFYSKIISITKKSLDNLSSVNTKIAAACEFINNHYNTDISLTNVADYVMLNPSYFSTIFKAQKKITFIDYLNTLRIDKAKKLIIDSKLSLTEIAKKIGYNNYQQFNRYFKKFEGVTPKQYSEQAHLKAIKSNNL